MTISNALENQLLDLVFNNTSFAPIVTVWGSLHTAAPGETGTGSPLASTPRFSISFGLPGSATVANDATASVVTSASGTITDIGLWDGSATGTATHLWSGALTAAKAVNAGDTITLAVGGLTVTLD